MSTVPYLQFYEFRSDLSNICPNNPEQRKVVEKTNLAVKDYPILQKFADFLPRKVVKLETLTVFLQKKSCRSKKFKALLFSQEKLPKFSCNGDLEKFAGMVSPYLEHLLIYLENYRLALENINCCKFSLLSFSDFRKWSN